MMRAILVVFFFSAICYGELSLPPKSTEQQYLSWTNLLKNPGFELGKTGWTSTGGTFTIENTAAFQGVRRGLFDASSTGQVVQAGAYTVTSGYERLSGVASCMIKATTGAPTHTIEAYDGTNVIGSATIVTVTTGWMRNSVNFPFPLESSTVRLRLQSHADEPEISFDDCKFGLAEGFNIFTSSQTHYVGTAYFPTTANCTWSRSNAALGAFTSDADCPGPTVQDSYIGSWQTTDANLPQWTVNNLPPGRYVATVTVPMETGTAAAQTYFTLALSDGTNTRGEATTYLDTTTDADAVTITATFEYTASGDRTFALFGAGGGGDAIVIPSNGSGVAKVGLQLVRYPLSTEMSYTPDAQGWQVIADLTGANPSLGIASVATYTEITNAGLTLTPVSGSQPAGTMCQTTNAATAPSSSPTTCAAGEESVGLNFNIPRAGWYEACVQFSHQIQVDSAESVISAFQIIETPTNAQTFTQECGPRISSRLQAETIAAGVDEFGRFPVTACGQCNFTSAGNKGLRLMYEQLVSGTPDTSSVRADADAAEGQAAIRITVRPLVPSLQTPLLVNSVVNSSSGATRVESARLNCDGASSITAQQGSWISAIGNISAGACSVTIIGSIFSTAPYCSVVSETPAGGDPQILGLTTAPTTTSVSVDCSDNAGTDCTAYDFELICIGSK